ncbi:GTP-binding protein [Candidatus Woesearchaeota archaeon]|nr:GTP-binding protein [Candidatus Woesearchaeota archaeon]
MVDYLTKIKELEDELSKTLYNKKTQHHIGLVKAKIAGLKERQETRSKGGKAPEGYSVRKSGDATVILVGYPSVGKSTLLNVLTDAQSEVGAYAFTTLTVIPGILDYKSSKIQILDVPGIVSGAAAGTGRGKEVLAVIRAADLVLFIIEVHHPEHYEILKKEIYDTNLRLNEQKPDVKIIKKPRGGLSIATTVKLTHASIDTMKAVLKEMRINNADIVIRTDITIDQLIDAIEGNKTYLPALVVVNKIDLASPEQATAIKKQFPKAVYISANAKYNIEGLKEAIYRQLRFIRIYCKEVGKPADMNIPLIMREGTTLRRMCERLHKDFVSKFSYARVWGSSSKFPGQQWSKLDKELHDGDVVELHLK